MNLDLFSSTGRSAVISEDGLYRYRLDRIWNDELPRICWIMLNPSTADGDLDDNTIRRILDYSKRWGYGSLAVGNLYAFRATQPPDLKAAADPIGPEADAYLRQIIGESSRVMVGWGMSPRKLGIPGWGTRVAMIESLTRAQKMVPYALGVTTKGDPLHPLYLAKELEPRPWSEFLTSP